MRYFNGLLCLGFTVVVSHIGLAQNMSINSTGALPDSSAMLDVKASDRGILIPRTDTATVNSSGISLANGLLIYQTNDSKFYYYDGAKWIVIDGPNTDNQTIDAFSLSGNTLSLSLEDDGQATQTVDLSSVNTDDQTIDAFSLSGNTLSLSLEDDGQATQTVDLSSVNTDDQTIDAFSLSGNTLSLSLEDDGQAAQTVDLSSVNTDDQTIDGFSLSGSTLSLSLEDDGQSAQTVDFTALLPVGSIIMYPGSNAPTNWLICDGSTFSASTYPDLNTLLGGSTLPDFSGRFPLGVGNSGESGSTNHSLGSTGGEETHTLTTSEMPSHNHGSGTLQTEEPVLSQEDDGTGNQDARDGSDKKLFEYNDITGSTGSTGGGNAHNTMPPYLTVNYIIKAK